MESHSRDPAIGEGSNREKPFITLSHFLSFGELEQSAVLSQHEALLSQVHSAVGCVNTALTKRDFTCMT